MCCTLASEDKTRANDAILHTADYSPLLSDVALHINCHGDDTTIVVCIVFSSRSFLSNRFRLNYAIMIVLHVGKCTGNQAARAELGRYPILIDASLATGY